MSDAARTRRRAIARLVPAVALAASALALPGPTAGATGLVTTRAQEPPGAGIAAADTALEARVRELASGLRCPVCQGLSIEDSPTELAVEMKNIIREQLAAGRFPEEVRQYFVERYGEWVLLQPRASGFNLVVYVLPWVALLAGGAVIVVGVRRWTRQGAGAESASGGETG